MLTLKRDYSGSYTIQGHDMEHVVSIHRSYDNEKYWVCEGHTFGSLRDAKAFMFEELSNLDYLLDD